MDKFDLMILDFDGVVLDSEVTAHEALIEAIEEEFQVEFDLEFILDEFVGYAQGEVPRILERIVGRKLTDSFIKNYREKIDNAVSNDSKLVRGIDKIIREQEIPICIASNSPKERIKEHLRKSGLLSYLENRIFSANDTSRAKPYPDIYLHTAKKMNVAPQNCLVIEDSPIGVKAAVAANMTVFGYSKITDSNKLYDAGAIHTFKSMKMLFEEIKLYEYRQASL